MGLTLFNVVYLVTFVLATYSIYKILGSFLGELVVSKRVCFISFAIYYVIVASMVLLVNIPILNLVLNIVLYSLLSFNFEGRVGKRIIAVFFSYASAFCIDMVGVTISGYVNFPVNKRLDYQSISGCIIITLILFVFAILVSRFKSTKKNIRIPITYWCVIVAIPIASIIVLLIVLTSNSVSQAEILISVILMFLINFFVFYLYEKISEFVEDEQKKQVLLEQNKHYEKQIELMDTTLKATQSIRHDIKNHIGVIYGSLSNGDTKTAMEHISSMMTVYKYKNTFITGNAAIDSVLNFKIEEAKQNGITLEAYTELPENVGLDSFDSSVILGNLLDNAFEAVSVLPDNRTVKCGVRYRCGLMVIEVSNPFKGKRIKEGANYLTTKLDKKYHGIGLNNVRDIAKKYNGVLDLSEKDNVFKAVVTMYV